MKKALSILAGLIGLISSFLGLFQFFTGVSDFSELKSIISGVQESPVSSSSTLGEDPEKAYLNINCSTDNNDSTKDDLYSKILTPSERPRTTDVSCLIKIDGKICGQSPIEGYEIMPGKKRISVTKKGFISEIFDYSFPQGSSTAIAVKVFPNTEKGVQDRNIQIKYLSLRANVKGLKGIVRTVNISLLIGWIVLAIAFFIIAGIDTEGIKLFLFISIVPIVSVVLSPMAVEPLLRLFENRIITVVLSSLLPFLVVIGAMAFSKD